MKLILPPQKPLRSEASLRGAKKLNAVACGLTGVEAECQDSLLLMGNAKSVGFGDSQGRSHEESPRAAKWGNHSAWLEIHCRKDWIKFKGLIIDERLRPYIRKNPLEGHKWHKLTWSWQILISRLMNSARLTGRLAMFRK